MPLSYDMDDHMNEGLQIVQAQSKRESTGSKSAYIGYIEQYDPILHQVIVLNPLAGAPPNPQAQLQQGGNQQGTPLRTAFIPLSSSFVGIANGINPVNGNVIPGMQIAPLGGATIDNPQAGEQVLVINIENDIGYSACAFLLFNNIALPPGGHIPVTDAQLQPGEFLYVTPSGTTCHFALNGDLNIYVRNDGDQTGNLNVTANGGIGIATVDDGTPPVAPHVGDIDLTANRDINLDVTRDLIGQADRDIMLDATRNVNVTADVNINLESTAAMLLDAGTTLTETAGGAATRDAGTDITDTAGGLLSQNANAIETTAGTTITISAAGIITIQSAAVVNVNAPAVNAGVVADPFLFLLTVAFLAAFNSHTHSGITTGAGVSGPPVVPVLPGAPISTVSLAAN